MFLQGYITNMETIPLPEGCSEENCIWWVSVLQQQVDDDNYICVATTKEKATEINNTWTEGSGPASQLFSTLPRGRTVVVKTNQRSDKGIAQFTIIGYKNITTFNNAHISTPIYSNAVASPLPTPEPWNPGHEHGRG